MPSHCRSFVATVHMHPLSLLYPPLPTRTPETMLIFRCKRSLQVATALNALVMPECRAPCIIAPLQPNIPPPAPPPGLAPPLVAASPCIFSETLTFTSKNLATHRSRHTDSPLFKSDSRYSGGMHFLVQVSTSLCRVSLDRYAELCCYQCR